LLASEMSDEIGFRQQLSMTSFEYVNQNTVSKTVSQGKVPVGT